MYQWKETKNIEEFDAFVNSHPLGNSMQLSAWSKVKSDWDSIYGIVVDEQGKIVASALLLKRSLGLGWTLGYIPRGPIMDFENEELCKVFFDNLRRVAKRERMISVKMDPNVFGEYEIHDKEGAQGYRNDRFVNTLKKYGCKHHGHTMDMYEATQPRFQLTFPVNENYKERFPKKTRDKIKHALEYHIEIEEKHEEAVEEFYEMINYTEKRKGIVLRNSEYFKRMLMAFKEQSVLLFAYLNVDLLKQDLIYRKEELQNKLNQLDELAVNKREVALKQLAKAQREYETICKEEKSRILVSALLLIEDAHTVELLYSGLNENYRQYLAPYALRNAGIEWAYRQGREYFNFGGVQGSLEDGLFEFKSSFHPMIRSYVGEFDLPIRPLFYKAMEVAIHLNKKIKLALAKKGK